MSVSESIIVSWGMSSILLMGDGEGCSHGGRDSGEGGGRDNDGDDGGGGRGKKS